MTGAIATTPSPLARVDGVVIELEEVSLMPVGDIVVDVGLLDLGVVVVEGHPDDAIRSVWGVTNLILQGLSPVSTSVAEIACETIFTVRVSHLDEISAVVESQNIEHNVGVALDEIVFVPVFIARTWGSTSDDVF